MMDQITERPTTEIAEIDRHKYYLSEKAGYDVGWEFAEQDWEANFAATFRSEQAIVENPCDSETTVRIDAGHEQSGFGKVLKRIFNRKQSAK